MREPIRSASFTGNRVAAPTFNSTSWIPTPSPASRAGHRRAQRRLADEQLTHGQALGGGFRVCRRWEHDAARLAHAPEVHRHQPGGHQRDTDTVEDVEAQQGGALQFARHEDGAALENARVVVEDLDRDTEEFELAEQAIAGLATTDTDLTPLKQELDFLKRRQAYRAGNVAERIESVLY